jgi:hypothetical protein
MQAYNENMSDTDSDLMINSVLLPDSFYSANSYMLAMFSLAKSAFLSYFKPSLNLDNAFYFSPAIVFDAPTMFELYGEKMMFHQSKKKAKLAPLLDCSQHAGVEVQIDYQGPAVSEALRMVVGQKRKKTNGSKTPTCTSKKLKVQ